MIDGVLRTRSSAAERVQVWLAPLDQVTEDLQRQYIDRLRPAERSRWERFRAPGAQLQYLVARALLDSVLKKLAPIPSSEWRFGLNDYGKPHIEAPAIYRGLQFNLSHTDGLVACAVSADSEIGVDVENHARDFDLVDLARANFAPRETSEVEHVEPAQQRELFFTYWTLKEAYIKARGLGLSIPLDGFWFELGGVAPRVQFEDSCPDSANSWRFWSLSPAPGYSLGLATRTSGRDIRLDIEWLVPRAPKRSESTLSPAMVSFSLAD